MIGRLASTLTSPWHFLLAAGCTLAAGPALAQTSAPAAVASASPQSAYDVVSVKPYKAGSDSGVTMWWKSTKDGFSAAGLTLQQLMVSAFGILTPDQIEGLPGWGDSAQFAIEAKMDEDTATAFEKMTKKERVHAQQQMLQGLLADRFRLSIHHESREKPVYDLVVAKSGSKLAESPAGNGGYSMGNGQLTGKGITIDTLTFSLSNEVGRLVVDKTGLTGKYEMALKWTPDDAQGESDAGPSIFAALEEQLGLKLVSAKGPVDTIVVDHAEKPSEN